MNKQYVDNWAVLESLLDDLKSQNGSHAKPRRIFRGLTSEAHLLLPRIGRPGIRKNLEDGSPLPPHDPKQEIAALARLKSEASLSSIRLRAKTALEWLAVAQHHNMPTRMMDWTTDPFIAAWFAATKAGTDMSGPPVIYSLDTPPRVSANCDPFGIAEVVAYIPPTKLHPRIEKQKSVLTIHPQPDVPDALEVDMFVLPCGRETFTIKRRLYERNIHWGVLLPDMEGITQHIGWEYKWGLEM